jgi:hypothetical protein
MGGARNHPNNLASFPAGSNVFGGVRFNVEGMIQLGGGYAKSSPPIAIGAAAARLHLLHGTAGLVRDGTEIATLLLHYAGGDREALPICYGVHVRDWWMWKKDESPYVGPDSQVAWQGENEFSKSKNCMIRVFISTFTNPRPEAVIEAIEYVRAKSAGSTTPFLLGITIE